MTLGLYRLWRHRHPRFGGMQVGFRDLTVWSFLMASAHGAGFMVLPFVMPTPAALAAASHVHASHAAVAGANVATGDVGAMAVGASHAGLSRRDGTRLPGSCIASWASASCDGPGSTWTGCGPARWS